MLLFERLARTGDRCGTVAGLKICHFEQHTEERKETGSSSVRIGTCTCYPLTSSLISAHSNMHEAT